MNMRKLKPIFFTFLFFISSALSANTIDKVEDYVSDASITTAIKAKLAKDRLLSPFKISVTTKKGVVYLDGTVESVLQYKKAVINSVNTNGVKLVNANKLRVKDSGMPLNDVAIVAQAEAQIIKYNYKNSRKSIDLKRLEIESNNGTVFVSGKVKNSQQRQALMNILNSVEGVKNVKSSVDVG